VSHEQRQRATAGLVLFVALSFLGSWFVAATLRVFDLSVAPGSIGTRLFTTSLLYAAAMGWQPVVAAWVVRRWIDPPDDLDIGLRPTRKGFVTVGILAALGFPAASAGIALLAGELGLVSPSPLNGSAEPALTIEAPGGIGWLGFAVVFAATLGLVWLQAATEEVGWRGYFLPRAMERFGRWPGLLLQGATWGLWYAPVLFLASYGHVGVLELAARSSGFVVTCVLLGTLFGWLRLAAKSIVPVIVANGTLTLAAGLPYLIYGFDAGARSAVFGVPGWFVMLVAIAGLSLSRWRSAVQIPEQLTPPARGRATAILRILAGESRPANGRQLH